MPPPSFIGEHTRARTDGGQVADFFIVIEGNGADAAADMVMSVVDQDDSPYRVESSRSAVILPSAEKVFDPVVLTAITITLSIPGAIFGAMNVADRIRNREKAQRVIDTAIHAQREVRVRITVRASNGEVWEVERLEADEFLTIAEDAGRARP